MLRAALIGAAGLVTAGLAGGLHPALDSLRIGLPYACLALLVLAVIARGWYGRIGGLLAVVGALPLAQVAWSNTPPETPSLRLLQHNLRFTNPAPDLGARLAEHDIATLQEVWTAIPVIKALPHPHVLCLRRGVGSTAVVSRLPVVDQGCLDDAQAWMRVETPAGEVTVLALHLPWPWPAAGVNQHRQIARLSWMIQALPQPVVVGGDFNQMPWSDAVGRIAEASGTAPLPGIRASFWIKNILPLPIDHVLIPEGWAGSATLGGLHGADHTSIHALIGAP